MDRIQKLVASKKGLVDGMDLPDITKCAEEGGCLIHWLCRALHNHYESMAA